MIQFAYVDTCVFTDLLRCYNPRLMTLDLKPLGFLSPNMMKVLNEVIDHNGNIVVSAFVFIELLNKFYEIFKNDGFTIERLKALLKQTPSWLIIEDLNNSVVMASINVPSYVDGEAISVDDTVHVATAISRGDEMYFLTTDTKLRMLNIPKIHIVY